MADTPGIKWGDELERHALVVGLAEIGAGARTFEGLVVAKDSETLLDELMKLSIDDLRRVVLTRVLLEQRHREAAARS